MMVSAAVVMVNIAIFGLISEYPLGIGTQRFLTRDTLVNSDRYYQERFEAVRQKFAPESTVIIAANWHHVEYYLPNYIVLPFNSGTKWDQDVDVSVDESNDSLLFTLVELGLKADPDGLAVVVIFDPKLDEFNNTPQLTKKLPLPDGSQLTYIELGMDHQLNLDLNSFEVLHQ
jgi:hypothetical protein